MDGTVVRLAIAGVLAAHGAGHVLGWMPAWGVAKFEGVSSRSWALGPIIGEDASRLAAGVVFLLPTAGFLLAAAAFLTGQPWWRSVAVGAAVTSLASTALFPQAFTAGSTIGSVAVNAAVLVALLATDWGRSLA